MKQEQLYVLMQPEAKNSYWADHIRNGIRDGVREWNDTVCAVNPTDSAPDFSGRHVLVVGSNIDWLEASATQLMHKGAHPVIVNACMLPVRHFRCSGVVFELEEMMHKCLALLRSAGRKHTVLLGANPNSVTDHVKADAFAKTAAGLQPGDIVWAEGNLDRCIAGFAEDLASSDCDSVICANDTAAVCLIRCLTSMGYRLPEQLYIIGMGNSHVGANLKTGLTSVMFDYHEMGKTAVRLYHNLCQSPVPCHSTVSLPCRLVIRDSAPLNDKGFIPEILPMVTHPGGSYFDSSVIQNIIRVEAMLQAGDADDREILFGIARGESCDTIADKLFFTDRTVRYRLKKLVKQFGFENRADLEAALRQALGEAVNTQGEHSW